MVRKQNALFIQVIVLFAFLLLFPAGKVLAVDSAFDHTKMSDMSDFDPNNFKQPTGDTFKFGYIQIMSGAAAKNGEIHWAVVTWVAHDLNKRGGIMVDGKRKKIEIITGDAQGKPEIARKEAERLCVEEKVDVLWGLSGSHLCNAVSAVAKRYKVIYLNPSSMSDESMGEKYFHRYVFRTAPNVTQWNMAMAYYLSRQPAKKYAILNQDYSYGHQMAEALKTYLAKYDPKAEIVSEDYHELWLKDFAPYLTKVIAAGPDVLFTGDWTPDGENLLRQTRDMGLNLPIANIYVNSPDSLNAVGLEQSKNLTWCHNFLIGDTPKTDAERKFMKAWNQQWKTWKAPYNALYYKWPEFAIGATVSSTYWLFDVIERAGTTDPEAVIKVWEGDVYQSIIGVQTMRVEDHQAIYDMYACESTYPTKEVYAGQPYSEGYAGVSNLFTIPQKYCTPPIPEGLKDRLKK